MKRSLIGAIIGTTLLGSSIGARELVFPKIVDRLIPSKKLERIINDRVDERREQEKQGFGSLEGYEYMKWFLSKPFKKSKEINFGGFYIVGFSNAAEGLVKYSKSHSEKKEEIGQLLERLVIASLDKQICPNYILNKDDTLQEDGFYLSHLSIVLSMYQEQTGKKTYLDTNKRISRFLSNKTLESQKKHVRSFRNSQDRYPADQAAILYSLFLFDKENGEQISLKPIEEWFKFMENEGKDPKTGLPVSEVGGTKTGKYPRGCALSWTVRYMHEFAPKEASTLWEHYKEHFKENYGVFAGFREWPKGFNGPMTVDTGPIILGLGTSATVLGMFAAKEMGDDSTYLQIKSVEKIVRGTISAIGDERIKALSNDFLAKSIEFNYNQ